MFAGWEGTKVDEVTPVEMHWQCLLVSLEYVGHEDWKRVWGVVMSLGLEGGQWNKDLQMIAIGGDTRVLSSLARSTLGSLVVVYLEIVVIVEILVEYDTSALLGK
jgi:hypothetical protein